LTTTQAIPTISTIPGPKGHFLLGSLPDIRNDRVQFLIDLQRDYGDVVRIRFGPASGIAIFHPDAIQRVMRDNQSNYSKETLAFTTMKYVVGNGLITSNGDFWLRQRRLMQPAFHQDKINTLVDMIVQETQAKLDQMESAAEGSQVVNLSHEMMNLTLAVATRSLFGSRVQDMDGDLGETMRFLMEDTIFRFEYPFYPPPWFPAKRNTQLAAANKKIDQVIYGVIAERRKHPGEKNNLLDMMMEAQLEESESTAGEPRRMTDEQLRNEVITLFLAGHETTSVNLCWTLYLLAQHPQVEAKLRKELDDVLAGRPPTLEDLPRLEYTRMVRDESLRLFPPIWLTERKTLGDDEMCGFHIPAGSRLAITQYVTHRHPQFWENPDAFDPERFSAERSRGRHPYAYFPFAGGQRQCLGKNLAQIETQLVLAMLLQRYRFAIEPGWQVIKNPQLSLRMKGGLPMRLQPA
jgi:cytochrome P450